MTKNKKTVLDDTKYQEFQIECLGTTMTFKYKTRMRFQSRKEKGGVLVYRYDPANKTRNTISAEFKFPNEAGTIITNDNLKYID